MADPEKPGSSAGTHVAGDTSALRVAEQEAARRRREVETLLLAADRFSSASEPEEVLKEAMEIAAGLAPVERVTVATREGDEAVLRYSWISGIWEALSIPLPLARSLAGHVIVTASPFRSDDLSREPRFLWLQRGRPPQRALCVPVQGRDGQVLGALSLFDRLDGQPFSDDDLRLAAGVAHYAAIALERVTLMAELRRREERFRSLVQNATDIIAVLDADLVVRYLSPSVQRALGEPPERLIGASVLTIVHPDDRAQVEGFFAADLAREPAIEFRVRHCDGSWRYWDVLASDQLQDAAVTGIVLNARDITERKRFETQLAYQAFHDALTGLPNRVLFLDRLQHALHRSGRREDRVAVLFLDLDRFKVINDTLGHDRGDGLLVSVANRLSACLRPSDTVARFGGDEFAVLMEDMAQPSDATRVAERILETLRQPFTLDGHELFVTVSIGITYNSAKTVEPGDLLREADIALYQAKALGKARYAIYDAAMSSRALERLELETELRWALERGELRLLYQPEIDLATNRIVGAEALLRWQHPRRGLLPPADFMPLAEETGLILSIGRWVLGEACREARVLQERRAGQPFLMTVNLSARQFQQSDLVDQVLTALQQSGLEPAALRLEISESTMMQDAEATLRTLRALKQRGVQVAIDDFGTGYSSLSYLRHFAVDGLKIDRSFVGVGEGDVSSARLVQAIAALAQALGIEVMAEGIETGEQLAFLRTLHCERGQGYYFSPPISADAISSLLEAGISPSPPV